MTPFESQQTSLAFWRALALVLALTVTLLVGFIVGRNSADEAREAAEMSVAGVEAFAAFLQEAEDTELQRLHRALGRLIEGETPSADEGGVGEVLALFADQDAVTIYQAREALWLSMLALPDDFTIDDFEISDHNEY